MKYLVIGLGNIGAEYKNTRHNIGFKIIDHLAQSKDATITTERYGDVAQIKIKGRSITLLKPSTYMNLSGNAVRYWMQQLSLDETQILVLVDDIAIPFGTLRMRKNGSDAGHNGLKHINEILTHQNYARLRFGIGGNFARGFQADYVLGQWAEDETKLLPELIEKSAQAVTTFIMMGVDKAMNTVNIKPKKEQ